MENTAYASGSIQAIRYHQGHSSTVTLRYEIRISAGDKYWIFLQGGPTGYEAMPFDGILDAVSRQVPWAANFGNSTYAQLDVPWEELKKVWDVHPELHPWEKLKEIGDAHLELQCTSKASEVVKDSNAPCGTCLMTLVPSSVRIDKGSLILQKDVKVTINVSALQGVVQYQGKEEALEMLGDEFKFACNIILEDDNVL